jgi:hypothetical protein
MKARLKKNLLAAGCKTYTLPNFYSRASERPKQKTQQNIRL